MSPEEIVLDGLQLAISTMESMVVNEGQRSILSDKIIPDFKQNATKDILSGWDFVSAGPYSDFIGETTEAGNQIMDYAFKTAYKIMLLNYIV